MLREKATEAICNCGINREVAERIVLNAKEDRLEEVATSPSWALLDYWIETIPFEIRERRCKNRIELASILPTFGFREDIVRGVEQNKTSHFGHLSARGWAGHIAVQVYSMTCGV